MPFRAQKSLLKNQEAFIET